MSGLSPKLADLGATFGGAATHTNVNDTTERTDIWEELYHSASCVTAQSVRQCQSAMVD